MSLWRSFCSVQNHWTKNPQHWSSAPPLKFIRNQNQIFSQTPNSDAFSFALEKPPTTEAKISIVNKQRTAFNARQGIGWCFPNRPSIRKTKKHLSVLRAFAVHHLPGNFTRLRRESPVKNGRFKKRNPLCPANGGNALKQGCPLYLYAVLCNHP